MIVDAIRDPLVHMIRNATDHGLDDPDVREKKPWAKLATGA